MADRLAPACQARVMRPWSDPCDNLFHDDLRVIMEIGVHLAPCHSDAMAAATRAFARAAEELGYDRVWAVEKDGEPLDPLVGLAFVAALTERVGLGAVVRGDDRPPAPLARALTTLSDLGRDRLSVALDMRAPEPLLEPIMVSAATRPRVLLTASTPQALTRVARHADGWLVDDRIPVDQVASRFATVRDLAGRAGRDPESMVLVAEVAVSLTQTPLGLHRRRYVGSAMQVAEDLDTLRRAGVDEVVLVVAGRCGLDQTLDTFAALAEAAEIISRDATRGARAT